MKRYDIYYYEYNFSTGVYDNKQYIDTIYLDESETMMDGIKQARLNHDQYKWLENIGCGIHDIWELTSEHTKDFYHIVLKEKKSLFTTGKRNEHY